MRECFRTNTGIRFHLNLLDKIGLSPANPGSPATRLAISACSCPFRIRPRLYLMSASIPPPIIIPQNSSSPGPTTSPPAWENGARTPSTANTSTSSSDGASNYDIIPPTHLRLARTLVLCFDGTGDEFGTYVGVIPAASYSDLISAA